VLRPKLLPNQNLGVAAGQEVLDRLPFRIVRQFHVQDYARMVLAQFLFFLILRGLWHRCEEPCLENLARRTIHLRNVFIHLYDDGEDVIRFSVLIFPKDKNAVSILYARALLLPRQRDPPLCLLIKEALASSQS
jgi:hypothetical protein